MQSVTDLRELLVRNGVSGSQSEMYVRHLKKHAEMCRARTEITTPWRREFVRRASNVTRLHPMVRILNMMPPSERRAACEALHDLIMEGV